MNESQILEVLQNLMAYEGGSAPLRDVLPTELLTTSTPNVGGTLAIASLRAYANQLKELGLISSCSDDAQLLITISGRGKALLRVAR